MKNWLAALALLSLSCAPPPTAPTEIKISNQNTNNNGQSTTPSPGSCTTIDSVSQNVPPSINHGTPVAISMGASSGGSTVGLGQACGAAAWVVQAPCFVANAGAGSTTLNSSAQDLSGCSVQACIGSVCAAAQIVSVN